MTTRMLIGDCRHVLATLNEASVHCVVTSPPYFGLRDYGTAQWQGGDPECNHRRFNGYPSGLVGTTDAQDTGKFFKDKCSKCGAYRIDNQIGLEPTPDTYVAEIVSVFREVRRVLRDDGTVWLNLGDSYASGEHGLKPKDLLGIPWLVAFALRQPYYTGRIKNERDRIWLAAMLDAEGCICGSEYENNGRTKTNLYISVTNTSVPVIANCERIFPQDVKHVYEKSGPSSRVCYRWDVERMETKAEFIREIYPYLIAKRKQAIVGYTFLEMQRGLVSKKTGYLVEQHEQRSWLMAALSKLNGGEDVDLPDWMIDPPSMFEPGYYLRQDIIWAKSNPMPESVRDRCTKAHEYIFLLAKNARYYFDADAIKESSIDPPDKSRGGSLSQNGNDPFIAGYAHRGPEYASNRWRNKRDVWEIASQPFAEAHFATFPPALIEPCIMAGCQKGGTVLDPFAGAGTTGLVADRLGRNAILIELNPDYAEMTERRIKDDAGMFAEIL